MTRAAAAEPIHPSIVAATPNLKGWVTVPEVKSSIRRSRSFIMDRVAEGDFVAVQGKLGAKGSRVLISAESVRAWLQRSLVVHPE